MIIDRLKDLSIVVLATATLAVGTVNADSADSEPMGAKSVFSDKWMFWVGAFFPSLDSRLRLDSDMGSPGNGLDLEDQLGLDENKSILWGGARWRFAKRHKVEVEFVNLRRNGINSFTLEDYQIGNYKINAGGEIGTTFDLVIARTTYGYSVIQNKKHELDLKAGFHLTNLELKLQLAGVIEDADTGQNPCAPDPFCVTPVLETDEFTFPLPHVGLSYGYAFTPKLALRTQGIGFYIVINDIKGSLLELDLDLNYRPWKNVGFGAGLRYFRATVDDKGDKLFRGKFVYEYWGPVIYGIVSF